ncbi:MAG: Nif3-like dinuclear metal center hexameric protein, partial [Candidatus Gastranaerophilales bacterium]|nr:Nif3-like dinuclear metal center hexameric protein [Candidatus Gastranaerophilales bacterium]
IELTEIDAFVTGELKFHSALDTKIPVFDIGHFESEIFILETFREIAGIETIIADESSPFIY